MPGLGETKRRWVLIGLRGSGKTTIGRELARRLGLPFHDSDLALAERWGRTAGELLRECGEAEFRRREQGVIGELSRHPEAVLALGGGAPAVPDNRDALRDWRIILLDAPDEVLMDRCGRDDPTERPSLTDLPPLEEIRHLRETRWPRYLEWKPRIVPSVPGSPEEVVDAILLAISEDGTEG